jgi:hypothetical protein
LNEEIAMLSTGPEPVNPELNTEHFGYMQHLPPPVLASEWRPEGAEGDAQISVAKAITLTINPLVKVRFEQGVCIVPRFFRWSKGVWDPKENVVNSIEIVTPIAGDYDDPKSEKGKPDLRAMHPYLRGTGGAKRSGQQPSDDFVPASVAEPLAPEESLDDKIRRIMLEVLAGMKQPQAA